MRKEYILIFLAVLVVFISSCNSNILKKSSPFNKEINENKIQQQDEDIIDDNYVYEESCISTNEICDGVDNDCDKRVDEAIGLCPFGQICSGGRCVNCPLGKSVKEICDGKDNDCDGLVDEELRDNCGKCISPLRKYPVNYEFCDGKDNDCDGLVDEEDGNECNNFVCRTTSKGDYCDIGVKYKCIDKQCFSTKICNDEYNCYWDWVDEEGGQGVEGMKDIRLWVGPKYNGENVKYYCGEFDTNSQRVLSSCEGNGCVAQLCRGGSDCPIACYATLDGSLLHLRKCINYPGISKICG